MTLNLLTTVPDGMVLLADSMLTLATAEITNYQNAEKLITLGAHPLPAAAMISGTGGVNGKLVSALLRRVSAQLDSGVVAQVHQQVVDAIAATIDPEYDQMVHEIRKGEAIRWSQVSELAEINTERQKQNLPALPQIEETHILVQGRNDNHADAFVKVVPPILTLVVATYFGDDPQKTEMWWPGTSSAVQTPLGWWGSGITAVARLTMGCDYGRLRALAEAEAVATPNVNDARNAEQYILSKQPDFTMGIPFDSLPLQDAIELTEFLGKVSCAYDQFSLGSVRVGGPLDVLVLKPGERIWVHKKEIHTSLK